MAEPFFIADALRACLDDAYDTAADPDKPAKIGLRAGQEAPLNFGTREDECCAGLGWVRIASIEPVTTSQVGGGFGTRTVDNPCQLHSRTVTFELGVARCAPFGTNEAGPTEDQWAALVLRVDDDALRMRQAVCCYRTSLEGDPLREFWDVKEGLWEPLSLEGMCAGGTMLVTVGMECNGC